MAQHRVPILLNKQRHRRLLLFAHSSSPTNPPSTPPYPFVSTPHTPHLSFRTSSHPTPPTPQATKLTLRHTLSDISSKHVDAFGMTQKRVEKRQQQLVRALGDEKSTVDASLAALRQLTMETMKMQYAMLPSR